MSMYVKSKLATVLVLLLSNAALADGTLAVKANIVGSVLLTVDTPSGMVSGGGSATFSSTLGSSWALDSAPAGFSMVRDGDVTTLSSSLRTKVIKANLTSTRYELTARLLRPLPEGVQWRVCGATLSSANAVTVTTSDYDTDNALWWEIVMSSSATRTPIDDIVIFTVVTK